MSASAFGVHDTVLKTVSGFYNKNESIFCEALCNPHDSKPLEYNVATLVHEGLHFILSVIFENGSDPTLYDDEVAAKELDEALNLDREHRKRMKASGGYDKLSDGAESMWGTLEGALENEHHYFPGGFNPQNPSHLRTMRVEAIVRPMEQMAIGATSEDIKAVAPNLWRYYQKKVIPRMEQWTQQMTKEHHLFGS